LTITKDVPVRSHPLGIPKEFCHIVKVVCVGEMMSLEAQQQRDELAEWFVRQDYDERDVDSVFGYMDVEPCDGGVWLRRKRTMIFGFKDPHKAMMFKLAWSGL
jgi:hypothetical protein